MQRQTSPAAIAPLVLLLAVAGCTGGTAPEPTAAPSTAAVSPAPTSEGPAGVDKTVEYEGGEVTVAVGPVRVSGDEGVIPLTVSVSEDAPSDFSFNPHSAFAAGNTNELGYVRAFDVDAGVVLVPGVDEDDRPVGTRKVSRLGAGDSAELEVLVAAPAGDRIDVLLPHVGLVQGVPVVDGDVPSTSDLGATGEVTFATPQLEAFTKSYDDSSSARAEGESATVTLGSDVLFATDESTLSPDAAAVVDEAAAQIVAAGSGGEVLVVGHTDDQASDEYNLDLSRKRAASVAERLTGTLGAAFTLAVDGKGESEPVAEGTSAAARAANRRVEIRFTVTSQEALLGAGEATAPEPDGPVAAGDGTVEFTVRDVVSRARVSSVRRLDGYLVGELEITRVSGGGSPVPGLLSAPGKRYVQRGISDFLATNGAVNVTLLGSGGWVYPVEYLLPGSDTARGILADSRLYAAPEDGETMTVTVVWPDVGGDTVDVDVPERFRITDVPVEG